MGNFYFILFFYIDPVLSERASDMSELDVKIF